MRDAPNSALKDAIMCLFVTNGGRMATIDVWSECDAVAFALAGRNQGGASEYLDGARGLVNAVPHWDGPASWRPRG